MLDTLLERVTDGILWYLPSRISVMEVKLWKEKQSVETQSLIGYKHMSHLSWGKLFSPELKCNCSAIHDHCPWPNPKEVHRMRCANILTRDITKHFWVAGCPRTVSLTQWHRSGRWFSCSLNLQLGGGCVHMPIPWLFYSRTNTSTTGPGINAMCDLSYKVKQGPKPAKNGNFVIRTEMIL